MTSVQAAPVTLQMGEKEVAVNELAQASEQYLNSLARTERPDEHVNPDQMDCPDWLQKGLKLFSKGKGTFVKGDVISSLTKLAMRREASANNSNEFDYRDMPERIQEVMRIWDTVGGGTVGADELMAAAKAQQQLAQEKKQVKRFVMVMAVMIVVLACMNFVMAFVSSEFSKDMKPTEKGVLAATPGRLQQNNKASMGVLVTETHDAADVEERRLYAPEVDDFEEGTNALGTRQVMIEGALSSTLSDEDLRELRHVTINSGEEGSPSIEMKVISRLREDTVQSRCGSVVHIVTSYGRLTLDDNETYMSEEMWDKVHKSFSGFGNRRLSDGHHDARRGRRLAGHMKLGGFYNNFKGIKWECESVMKPQVMFQNYKMVTVTHHTCPDNKTCGSQFNAEQKDTRKMHDERNLKLITHVPGTEQTNTVTEEGKRMYKVRVTEESYVYNGETITKSYWPNHPLQKLVRAELEDKLITFQVFQGQAAYCDQQKRENVAPTMLRRMLKGEQLDADMFRMQYLGRTVDWTFGSYFPQGVPVRMFRIQAKNEKIAKEHKIIPVQYWDVDVPGQHKPYKYFIDDKHVSPLISETTIREIEELSEADWVAVRSAIPDDLAADKTAEDPRCTLGGRSAGIMKDLPKMGHPGDENLVHVKWYWDFMQNALRDAKVDSDDKFNGAPVGPALIENQFGTYWARIFGVETEDLPDGRNTTAQKFSRFMQGYVEEMRPLRMKDMWEMEERVSIGTGYTPLKLSDYTEEEIEKSMEKVQTMRRGLYEESIPEVPERRQLHPYVRPRDGKAHWGVEGTFCEEDFKCWVGKDIFWGPTEETTFQMHGCERHKVNAEVENLPFELYRCHWRNPIANVPGHAHLTPPEVGMAEMDMTQGLVRSAALYFKAKPKCDEKDETGRECKFTDATNQHWTVHASGEGGIVQTNSGEKTITYAANGKDLCRDVEPECEQLAEEGQCEDNQSQMAYECPITCIKRSSGWDGQKWCGGDENVEFTCHDSSRMCSFWRQQGFCDKTSDCEAGVAHDTKTCREYMETECQATCNECSNNKAKEVEIPEFTTGGNLVINMSRNFELMKSPPFCNLNTGPVEVCDGQECQMINIPCANYVGMRNVNMKFNYGGKQATTFGAIPDADYQINFNFPVTVSGDSFMLFQNHEMGAMDIGSSVIAHVKMFPFRRYNISDCVIRGQEGSQCRLFGDLFEQYDWFKFNVEGALWVPVQIDLMVVAFQALMFVQVSRFDHIPFVEKIERDFDDLLWSQISNQQGDQYPYCKYTGKFVCLGNAKNAIGLAFEN